MRAPVRSWRPRPLPIAIALGVALLGGWIGTETLSFRAAAGSASAGPSRSGGAEGLAAEARRLVEAGQVRAALAPAIAALRRDPTAVAAAQAVGLNAQAEGDTARADRLLGYAERLSRRDLQTHLWAIERSVGKGDTPSVLREYDLALRTSVSAPDLLFPILGAAIAEPQVQGGLIRRLAAGPIWRGAFLTFLATDTRVAPPTATAFLADAAPMGVRASQADVNALVGRSLDAQDPQTAWRAYRLSHPNADRSRVRDPGFAALTQEPAPFDWTVSDDGGLGVQGGGGGLRIEAGSGTAGSAIRQRQLLPPGGGYRLGTVAGRSTEGSLVWSFACVDGPVLAKVAIPNGPMRRIVSPRFTIPASCAVQTLELTVDASDTPQGLDAEIRRVELIPAAD